MSTQRAEFLGTQYPMAATQVPKTMDNLDVGTVGLVKNDEPDVDEDDSADEGQDLADTSTSTKKKKKKKPKKKVCSSL